MSILYDERKTVRKCDHDDLPEREDPTQDAAWCGTWFDCPTCGFSNLVPSDELKALLKEQRKALGDEDESPN